MPPTHREHRSPVAWVHDQLHKKQSSHYSTGEADHVPDASISKDSLSSQMLPVPRCESPSVLVVDETMSLDGFEPSTPRIPSSVMSGRRSVFVSDAREALNAVKRNHPSFGTAREASLDAFMDGVGGVDKGSGEVADHLEAVKNSIDVSHVNHFFAQIPHVIKVLEDVAKIHPFIHVAVLSFKAIYTLELQRRSNEEKVVAVLVEMGEMLEVLVHLEKVDQTTISVDGMKIEDRMRKLLADTTKEIKDCANACNTYTKAGTVSKLLKCAIWDAIFVKFVQLFAQRRSDFKFVLTTYISLKIDGVDRKIDILNEKMDEQATKTDFILQFLQTYIPAEHKDIFEDINQKGGPEAVLKNPTALRQVISSALKSNGDQASNKQAAARVRDSMETISKELVDPTIIIQNNYASFEAKFELQKSELTKEFDRVVRRESDRVIDAITTIGSHKRIIDIELQNIWKDMGWRGNVKARHFVLAIRDHYHERAEGRNQQGVVYPVDDDSWALPWISMKRLQSIVEAFDDDASGYVSIGAVNELMTSKPAQWSLLQWLAYWAIGWQSSATVYRDKIHEVFNKMFALRASIHISNQRLVDKYLDYIWQPIVLLTSSFQSFVPPDRVQIKFQSYIADEEDHLRRKLDHFKYHIDDMTTLALIIGPGRIEKHLFQLLYLIIKRDFEVMRLCRSRKIDERDLWDSIRSLWMVLAAVDDRHKELEESFRHQNLDPGQQFKMSYCRLFDHYHDPSALFNRKKLRDFDFPEHIYDDTKEKQDVDALQILNHPHENVSRQENDVDYANDMHGDLDNHQGYLQHSDPLQTILGCWYGLLYSAEGHLVVPVFSVHLRSSSLSTSTFESSGEIPGSSIFPSFTLTGQYNATQEEANPISFIVECPAPYEYRKFEGHLSDDLSMLSGTWDISGGIFGCFVFSRHSPELLLRRPSPLVAPPEKIRALWKFALSVIEDRVNKQTWSWTYFSKRRNMRKRYLDLQFRTYYGRPLDAEEELELKQRRQSLLPADARFYNSICEQRLRTESHHGVTCDSCGGVIAGARIVCLECDTHGKAFSTIDLCEDRRCVAAHIGLDHRSDLPSPHLPSHNVFKSRTVIHLRDFGKVELQAWAALQRAKSALEDLEERRRDPVLLKSGREVSQVEPVCMLCKTHLDWPSWYCMDCEGDVFICDICDLNGRGSPHGKYDISNTGRKPPNIGGKSAQKLHPPQREHKRSHRFVRCPAKVVESAMTIEHKLDHIDGRMSEMEARLSKVDGRLVQVDERLMRLEKLMERLSLTLATGRS